MALATLAMLGFGAPAMLTGMLLIALPLIAHWMHRRVRTRLVFPSLRLLRNIATSREQLGRWRKWLLFLLRAAAIALIVAAFARPFWSRVPSGPTGADGPGATLILIDTSASMAWQREGGASLFQHAVAAATDAIQAAARRGDLMLAIAAGSSPEPLLPTFTANAPVLHGVIAELSPGLHRADWPGTLTLAARRLAEMPGERRLIIVSDFQESNWREVLDTPWTHSLGPIPATLIPLPETPENNIGLHHPTLQPPFPTPGQPVRLTVRAANSSGQPASAELECRLNDLPLGRQSINLAPREAREVVFTHTFTEPGIATAVFSIGRDNLDADNRAHLAAVITERPPVAIVSDRDPHTPGSAVFYLLRALSPRATPGDAFDTRVLRPEEVSDHTLRGLRAVWITDAPPLDATAIQALRRHAGQSGLVLLAAGPAALKSLAAFDATPDEGWMPLQLGHAETADAPHAFLLREERDAAELLPAFDPSARDALSRVALHQRLVATAIHPEARLALRFRDGPPALAWRDTAAGRLIVAAFDPAREAGALGPSAVWVALVHALMETMPAADIPRTPAIAGADLLFSATGAIPGGAEPQLRDPNGQRLAAATFLLEHTTLTVSLPITRHIGFYTLHQGDTLLGIEAVNIDARESDPRRIPIETLATHLRTGPAAAAPSATPAGTGARGPHRQTPLWGWALGGGLILLALESLLLARWRR